MKQVIGGIVFGDDELIRVDRSTLPLNSVLPFHLFIVPPISKQPYLILKAGEVLSLSILTKYSEASYCILPVYENGCEAKLRELLYQMKKSKNRKEFCFFYFELKDVILSEEHSQNSRLLLFSLFHEFFYKLPKAIFLQQYELSSTFHFRSLEVSATATLLALESGFYSFEFLRDLYTISFHLDVGLYVEGGFNSLLYKAAQSENEHQSGCEALKELGASEQLTQTWLDHPDVSYKFLMNYRNYFSQVQLLKVVLRQHEKDDGHGFPLGIRKEVTSKAEKIVIQADRMAAFKVSNFHRKDIESYLIKIISLYPKFQRAI